MELAQATAKGESWRCQNCGAQVIFDPPSQKLKCSHCGTGREVPPDPNVSAVVEHPLADGLSLATKGLGVNQTDEPKVSRCQECGANVVFAGGKLAAKCTFCGSAKVLLQSENVNAIRPESLLPFAIDKPSANKLFGTWLGKLWFRPSDLKLLAKVQEVNGVYVPFWTFDAHAESRWRAEAGHWYYETEEYETQENGETVTRERKVRRTRWQSASGSRADDYDDVLVCASKGLPRDLAAKIRTFNTHELRPYAPGFLAGWSAEEYAVDLEAGYVEAEQIMAIEQQKRCDSDVPGDEHRGLQVDSRFFDQTWKHMLLPLWIAAYRYNDKVYRFLVNGQTGEIVGKAPWSVVKIALFTLFWIVVAVTLYLVFGHKN